VIAHEFKAHEICNFILIPLKPYPPPRGCILVYKKSLCCPYLSCSKYHINYYKNTERNRGENLNQLQVNHEKTLEKNSRLESDGDEEINGGKRNKNDGEMRNVNKKRETYTTSFQVALKVEVCMHPVSLSLHNR
jgi:hypothetical protein